MPKSRWTLITVTYNSATTLAHFWSTPPPEGVEWIVVDNNSTDGSAEMARSLGATRVVALDTNVGFGTANNKALAVAEGDYVAFVNPDVTVVYSDLEQLASLIGRTGGLVAPQLVNEDGSPQANGRGMPTLANKVRNRTSGVQGVEDRYNFYAAEDEERFVVWVMGAVVAGTATLIREIRGWDERFFIYYEDSDIGVRAWKHGASVAITGNARWVHGWARETSGIRLGPWIREIASMCRFYSSYPEFLLMRSRIPAIHRRAYRALGRNVAAPGGEFVQRDGVSSIV
jgi:N-acetylglucosaminyl-diphospho-decaprenol L-rhamnosyltransferase